MSEPTQAASLAPTPAEIEDICAVIEQGARLGFYLGTPAGDAYTRLPSWLTTRLRERQNEVTERILAQNKRCQGHKHSITLGDTVCLFCARFIPDAEVLADAQGASDV